MVLKKLMIALLFLVLTSVNTSVGATHYSMSLKKINTSITQSSLLWDSGSWQSIFFEVGIEQANTVDYRVVVGVWMYVNGFYSCGHPMKCYGWHWEYRYYSVIIPAGETYTNTNIGGDYWPVNQGEQVDNNNWYISYCGPN